MFLALAAGAVFLFLLYWVRRQTQAAGEETRKLKTELLNTQQDLTQAQNRSQQVIGLFDALLTHKVSPTGAVSWTDLGDFTVKTASPLLNAETVVCLRWDRPTGAFRGVSARGLAPQQLAELRVPLGQGILGRAAMNSQPVVVAGSTPDAAALAQENFITAPYLIFPLRAHSQAQGLLLFCQPKEGRFTTESTRLASALAKQVEVIMENLDLYQDRQRAYGEIVTTLVQAVISKHAAEQAHSEHCRALARAVARELKLPELLVEQIEFGAALHDVGKVGVSEALLSKPGPLTETEYAAMKKHPEIGYQLLRNIQFLKGIAPIVLYHQEWVNGQGYPEGLAGEEIPLGARIVGLVEAWDAMTTDQPYRKALPKNNAIAELRQQAGTQFDPKLVDVFLHVVASQPDA